MKYASLRNFTRQLLTFIIAAPASIIIFMSIGCKNNDVIIEGLDDLANPAIQPRILSTYPSPNSTGPFNVYDQGDNSNKPHFVLVFNKLITKSSITTKNIRISGFNRPVVARILKDSKSPYLPKPSSVQSDYYDYVLPFAIYDSAYSYEFMPYRVGQQYTVTLDSTIQDINGNHLTAGYSFSFAPEPYFRVAGFSPKNLAADVGTYVSPRIIFNSPIDRTTLTNLQLIPNPHGAWSRDFFDSLTAYYYLTQPSFPFNTSYTILVSPFAEDAGHHRIHQQYSSTFSTIPFKVTSTTPHDGDPFVSLTGGISISLSGSIDTGTVRSAFDISPVKDDTLNLYSYYQGFSFSPTNGWKQNTRYTVNVSSNLKARDGTSLDPFTMTFTTESFSVNYTIPNNGSYDVYRNTPISINTNARLDTESVHQSFNISPPINGYLSLYDGSNGFSFYHDQFIADTTYTVTISTALKTKAGDNLSYPHSFTFTTGQN